MKVLTQILRVHSKSAARSQRGIKITYTSLKMSLCYPVDSWKLNRRQQISQTECSYLEYTWFITDVIKKQWEHPPPNHWHPHLRKECRQKCTRVNALNGLDIVALTHTPAQCAQRQGEGACAHAWPRWRWLSSSYDKVQAYCIRHIDTMVCPSIGPSVGWMVTCFLFMPKKDNFLYQNHGGSPTLTLLNVVNMPMEASMACWALLFSSRSQRLRMFLNKEKQIRKL